MHEEEKHIDIREKLINLPKVKAKDDFMNALQRKINLADAEVNQKKISDEVKESIWVKLFGKKRNPWLIPSLSLTIVAIFVVSVFILNSGKETLVPTMSDFQKKDSPSGIVPDSKTLKEDTRTKTSDQDIVDNVVTGESKKSKEKITSDFEKEIISPSKISPSVQPPAEMERMKLSEPVKTEEGRDETGKSEIKKIEKNINKEIEQKFYEETIVPSEKNAKGDEVNQKIKSEDKKDSNKDAIESKGLIEKKEKNAMKRAVKTATDSTKIDKKVLEKIKEEIQKEK